MVWVAVADGIGRHHPSDLILPERARPTETNQQNPTSQPAARPASDSGLPLYLSSSPSSPSPISISNELWDWKGTLPTSPGQVLLNPAFSWCPRAGKRSGQRTSLDDRIPTPSFISSIHRPDRTPCRSQNATDNEPHLPVNMSLQELNPAQSPKHQTLPKSKSQHQDHHHPSRPSQVPEFFHHPRGWNMEHGTPKKRTQASQREVGRLTGCPPPRFFTTPTSILAEVCCCVCVCVCPNPASRLEAKLPTMHKDPSESSLSLCVCVACPNTRIPEWR